MHHEETTTFWTLCPADGWMLLRGRPARVKACHPRRPIDTRGADGHQGTGTRDTDGEDLSREILCGKDRYHRGWRHGRDRQEERGIPSLYHQDRIGHRRMELRVRGRGNSTWEWYPKKPYRIKLDEKAEILGLDANKDWVLLANYRDPTHLMNTFVFEMGQGLGMPYTNHTRFVEVTLNGDYKGLYQLTEQVEVAKGRVDIGKKKGWLLSLDVDDGPKEAPGAGDNFWSEVYRMPVCVKSPEAEDYATPETLREDARDALATLETAIQQHDYDALAKLCDIPVMIDYLLIQEFVYNVEVAAPRSIFLYKDKGDDAKWTFGPLWDFDAGFDFDWSQMTTGHKFFADYRETVLGTDPARHVSDYTYTSSFFTDMWKSKQFVSEVKVRWNRMRPRIMAEFWPRTKAYAEAAAGAMERDARRWPIDRQPKTEINRMEKWLNSRTVFMDNIVTNYPNGFNLYSLLADLDDPLCGKP